MFANLLYLNIFEEKILEEARKWIGLVPLTKNHVRYFHSDKITDDMDKMNENEYDEARAKAAAEFFSKEMNIFNVKIFSSKLSENKQHGILWVKVGESERLKILSTIARISIGRKLKIKLLTKIPFQYWNRNKSLEHNCYIKRQEDPNIRTQIRLGRKDIELWTKSNKEAYWRLTPIEAFGSVDPCSIHLPPNKTLTPEGRASKRGASSPLNSDQAKYPKGSNSPGPSG